VVQLATCCPDAVQVGVFPHNVDGLGPTHPIMQPCSPPPAMGCLALCAGGGVEQDLRASHARLEIMWWVCQTTAIVAIAGGKSIRTAGRRWMLY
jgi:hypothetical protein